MIALAHKRHKIAVFHGDVTANIDETAELLCSFYERILKRHGDKAGTAAVTLVLLRFLEKELPEMAEEREWLAFMYKRYVLQ